MSMTETAGAGAPPTIRELVERAGRVLAGEAPDTTDVDALGWDMACLADCIATLVRRLADMEARQAFLEAACLRLAGPGEWPDGAAEEGD